jgi:hypothetical protein
MLNIEAEELEQRRILLFGLIEKTGLWPILLAGNVAAGGLAKTGDAAGHGVATANLWSSYSAVAFVLVVANVSMKQYSMTLRRYAAMFKRARLLIDESEQPRATMAVADLEISEAELQATAQPHEPASDGDGLNVQPRRARKSLGARPDSGSGEGDAPSREAST